MMGRKTSKRGHFSLCKIQWTFRAVTLSLIVIQVCSAIDPASIDIKHTVSNNESDSVNINNIIGTVNPSEVINSSVLNPTLLTILQPTTVQVQTLELEKEKPSNSSSDLNSNIGVGIPLLDSQGQALSFPHNVTDTVQIANFTTPETETAVAGSAQNEKAETNQNQNPGDSSNTTIDPDFLLFLNSASVSKGDNATESSSQILNGTDHSKQLDQRSLPAAKSVQDINFIKDKALDSLMQIFGLAVHPTREVSPGPAPEFMIDLYNTITDSYGVTRAKNPYDAHVVRSFTERDNSLNDFFYFNISGLEETETVLEAELHIHRAQTPHEQLHPSLYLTPFYILSLYQVLDPKNLAIPDLHKLLGVHYVPALGSGWEVFNVKQPVLKWMEGNTQVNHGFLVAATSLGGDRVPVRFSRRGENSHSKQPILVLFTHDSQMKIEPPAVRPPVKGGGRPIHRAVSNPVQTSNNGTGIGQDARDDEPAAKIPTSSLENPRYHHALLFQDSIRHPNSVGRFRSRRSKNQTEGHGHVNDTNGPPLKNLTSCGRHDLFVNFEAIGWSSWIISPKGYNAFYCDGPCSFPLGQQVNPSNHATVQSIVHELNLAPDVGRPCCVPTTLLPISLLYYDNHDNVVLKQYVDMVADSCGCF